MRESGKVAIGRVVIRSKQQLCALRPTGDVMALTTMLFGDEVLAPDRLDELDGVEEAEATERELTMAQQLIDSLSAEFDPTKYKDEYRERVLDLIERKAAGEEIAVQPEAEEAARRAGPDGRAGGQPGRRRATRSPSALSPSERASPRTPTAPPASGARAPRPEPRRLGRRSPGPCVHKFW